MILNLDNDESRRVVENCYRTHKTLVNPIIDWATEDVWEFIKTEHIPYCGLYDRGRDRLGCVGCPMNSNAEAELNMYPKFKQAYIRAFDRMVAARAERGLRRDSWIFGEAVMDWWLHGGNAGDPNQTSLFEDTDT